MEVLEGIVGARLNPGMLFPCRKAGS
jgi:hypothetical protein